MRKALAFRKRSAVKPGHHATILIAVLGLGLAAAACSSATTGPTRWTRWTC